MFYVLRFAGVVECCPCWPLPLMLVSFGCTAGSCSLQLQLATRRSACVVVAYGCPPCVDVLPASPPCGWGRQTPQWDFYPAAVQWVLVRSSLLRRLCAWFGGCIGFRYSSPWQVGMPCAVLAVTAIESTAFMLTSSRLLLSTPQPRSYLRVHGSAFASVKVLVACLSGHPWCQHQQLQRLPCQGLFRNSLGLSAVHSRRSPPPGMHSSCIQPVAGLLLILPPLFASQSLLSIFWRVCDSHPAVLQSRSSFVHPISTRRVRPFLSLEECSALSVNPVVCALLPCTSCGVVGMVGCFHKTAGRQAGVPTYAR